MIEIKDGNIFESTCQTIVNPCNCIGIMGGGLALAFKNRYPDMFRCYQGICQNGAFCPGDLHLYKADDYWIINFPTKDHWQDPSLMQYVECGLQRFCEEYKDLGITSIAFPALGCGLGGLAWEDVFPVMESYLNDLPIRVEVYGPK